MPSVRRILVPITQGEPRLARRGPERANQATRDIPMRRIRWDESEPGHSEVDLVHRSGADASGSYGHTLQMTDVATGWGERVAVLGRGTPPCRTRSSRYWRACLSRSWSYTPVMPALITLPCATRGVIVSFLNVLAVPINS